LGKYTKLLILLILFIDQKTFTFVSAPFLQGRTLFPSCCAQSYPQMLWVTLFPIRLLAAGQQVLHAVCAVVAVNA
jgi:hypothetical protein